MMRRSTWSAVLGRPAATRRANVSTASGAVRRPRAAAFAVSPLRCSSHALRSARGKSELSAGGPAAGACASSTSRTPMTLVMRDPRERQAGHEMIPRMNCPNCAAPMALHATRPCWQCAHCGTMICPEPVADGLRVTDERGHECPVCHVALVRAALDDREMIEICDRCKGILLARHAFAVTVIGRRKSADTPSVTPRPVNRAELDRRIRCPQCAGNMIADWYYGGGNIVIDTCATCDLVWLDAGELRRAIDAPGADRRR